MSPRNPASTRAGERHVIGKAARMAVVVNIGAIAVPVLLRAVGAFGSSAEGVVAETGVGLVLLVGVGNLIWVVPSFLFATSIGRAAARRQRAYDLVLGAVLLAGLPFVVLGPLFVADWPETVTYLLLLYCVGYVRLRRLVAGSARAT